MAKILITAGGTSEKLDDVRVITNVSTGRLGALTAEEFAARGADVTFVCGRGSARPESAKIIEIESAADLRREISVLLKTQKFDAVIHAMAVSDYTPSARKGKISSDKKTITITLKKTPKIIAEIKKLAPRAQLVGFKLLSNVSEEELTARAAQTLKKNKCDFVFANDLKNISVNKHEGFLLGADGGKQYAKTKKQAARLIAKNVIMKI